jgi:acetyl-CoA carboxylase, biotin carboxylase subunit
MFKKILIANRGEIARRIMRTAREMGIQTVAVYSEADRLAPHVLESDQAVSIGPADPTASYLDIKKIIAAAEETGAEAIHPGYGFLAENPALPEACEAAGITFIGPPAGVIRDLGEKTRARRIMQAAGAPLIPGMLTSSAEPGELADQAHEIGYPVMVKAAGGGGGKGMRVVEDPADLPEACRQAMSEAGAAFGDPSIYLEKYLSGIRHVEVQVLADDRGNTVHLYERECSIQRRRQKIIEETPSPALTPKLRRAMGRAAVTIARAAGYVNAGTVEFLLDSESNFYFLEVNTRLQVEHAVTECVCGLDLVRRQILIAAGHPLPFQQEDIRQRGHAIQCRIYAENPAAGFAPSPGTIGLYREPTRPGVRVDSGVYQGLEIPMEYDPILSRLIVWGEDREAARMRMIAALSNYPILGVETNVAYLKEIMTHPAFASGETYTDFLDRHFAEWQPTFDNTDLACLAYVVNETTASAVPAGATNQPVPTTPWQALGNWRV